jgi:hypothetical protein
VDEDTFDDIEDAPRSDNRTAVLIAAGATIVLLFAVTVALSRKKRTSVPETAAEAMEQGDWRSTIEHLAEAWEQRFSLLSEQLDRLSGQPVPSAPPTPAAVSDVVNNGAPTVARVPPDMSVVGAEEPPPPGPAAVSMPPS